MIYVSYPYSSDEIDKMEEEFSNLDLEDEDMEIVKHRSSIEIIEEEDSDIDQTTIEVIYRPTSVELIEEDEYDKWELAYNILKITYELTCGHPHKTVDLRAIKKTLLRKRLTTKYQMSKHNLNKLILLLMKFNLLEQSKSLIRNHYRITERGRVEFENRNPDEMISIMMKAFRKAQHDTDYYSIAAGEI